MSDLSVVNSPNASRRDEDIERKRINRTAPISTPTPYKEIKALKRPDHGTKGEKVKLLVNWFKIKFDRTEIFVYKVVITEKSKPHNRGRSRPSQAPVEIKHPGTKSKILWNSLREYAFLNPDYFPNLHRVIFDDREFLFTPDMINGTQGLKLYCDHPDKRGKQVVVDLTPNVRFHLDLSGDIESHDAIWTSRFLKDLMSQNSRFVPADNADPREIEITKRFAHFNGGMFIIPRRVNDPQIDVQPGVQAWLGLYAAVRRMENFDPIINLKLVNKLFVKPNLDLVTFYLLIVHDPMADLKQLPEIPRNSCMVPSHVQNFNRKLSNIKLKCACVPGRDENNLVTGAVERHYTFIELNDHTSADRKELLVVDKNGRESKETRRRDGSILWVRYRREIMDKWYSAQGIRLKYPKLPLCVVKCGKRQDLIPMELLLTNDEEPQKYMKLLNFYARMRIIKALVRPPEVHHEQTNRIIERGLQYNEDPFLAEMKVEFNPNMIECEGRALEPCAVMAKSESDGRITMLEVDKEKGKFFISRAIESNPKKIRFVPFKLTPAITGTEVAEFYRELVKKCVELGVNVHKSDYQQPPVWKWWDPKPLPDGKRDFATIPAMIESVLNQYGKEKDDELLVFIFITKQHNELYGEIKTLCDLHHGIVSQIVDEETVRKATTKSPTEKPSDDKSVYHHISLKLNAKLGGINQIVAEADKPDAVPDRTMYIGIDVTHPSPNAQLKDCSLAAIVASLDANAAKYAVRIKVNSKCNEHVQLFDEHFAVLLDRYISYNSNLAKHQNSSERKSFFPDRIVILRDGVSDSQMIKAASQELNSLMETWTKITNGEPFPKFTYIIAQKNHGTRFYTLARTNPPRGTVVDSKVVTPHMFDFYMASHYTEQGTTRPIHYTVVYDDCNSSADVIQEVINRFCFLYARCSKSVSIPSPVYYAHLACERAAFHHEYNIKVGIVQEIRDKGDQESEDAYASRVTREAMDVEKELQVSDKHPGMYFI